MRSTGNLNGFYLFKRWLSKVPTEAPLSLSTGVRRTLLDLTVSRQSYHSEGSSKTTWTGLQIQDDVIFRIKFRLPFWSSIPIQGSMIVTHMIWLQSHLCLFTKHMTLGHMLKALSLLCQCWSKEALFKTLRDQQMTLAELEYNCKECTAN